MYAWHDIVVCITLVQNSVQRQTLVVMRTRNLMVTAEQEIP